MKKIIVVIIALLFFVASVQGISITSNRLSLDKKIVEESIAIANGPMDSPWPMYCHDPHHTGRSPYSTVDTWDEIWRFKTKGWATSSPVIDDQEIIYIGAHDFYAVYPNGTLKWKYDTPHVIESAAAIDENGIIYIGTEYAYPNDYLYAIYTTNGTLKWKYGADNIVSSPAIGNDGTIFFCDSNNWNIKALHPNGTLKWSFKTNHVIYSSPAIGQEGTVYFGSHDGNAYALYPNNGTLKWKFSTGSWVHGSPSIAADGTVYIGSDNGYLYALYPNNGTIKWQCNVGAIWASPALDEDGTLYVGVWEKMFYAIYPNGTVKWTYNPGERIWGSSAAISADGTIYFGTCDLETHGGEDLIALNPDGTERWRKHIGTLFSSPAIGIDGTVYIGASTSDDGYLYAFGPGELEANANGPYYGLINQPIKFTGASSGGHSPHMYYWDFGDTHTSEEQNPIHSYTSAGNYTIILTVTDNTSNTTTDSTYAWIQTTNTQPNKPTIDGPKSGAAGTTYNYKFSATDPDNSVIYLYIDWGDNINTGWVGPYNSGQQVILSHSWSKQDTYTIKARAKDPYDTEGPWGYLEVEMPVNYQQSIKFSIFLFDFLQIVKAGSSISYRRGLDRYSQSEQGYTHSILHVV